MSHDESLVKNPADIRLAILGMSEGNGHPYSWSAIINGSFDPVELKRSSYPGIHTYLSQEPPKNLGIPGARVTHIWTENPDDASHVAKVSNIQHIVENPLDVLGKVDAVILATDIGGEHAASAKPFVEAGLPVFVDKPLTDNVGDLEVFTQWIRDGKKILSSSAMRFAKEFTPYHLGNKHSLGALRFVLATTPKSWERYGIHALEAAYPILGPGFISATNTGTAKQNIVHCKHRSGADLLVVASQDITGSGFKLCLLGTESSVDLKMTDTFFAFKTQLVSFIHYLKTGKTPYPFSETNELMRLVIAGALSREESGREIFLEELSSHVHT